MIIDIIVAILIIAAGSIWIVVSSNVMNDGWNGERALFYAMVAFACLVVAIMLSSLGVSR